MSGIEVAGIVLGAIPVAISAIEKYRSTSQRVKYFKYKEPFIDRLIKSLKEQEWFLRLELQLILQAARPGAIMKLDRLTSKVLSAPDIEDAAREYLGDGFVVYTHAVDRCQEIIVDLVNSLGGLTSNPGNLGQLAKDYPVENGRCEISQRIRFALNKGELDQRINDLDQATIKLQRIRDSCTSRVQYISQTQSRTALKFTGALAVIRRYAESLYSAIAASYPTDCHPAHEARLFLQSRSSFMENKSRGLSKQLDISFTITFSPRMDIQNPIPSYKTDIKVVEEELTQDTNGQLTKASSAKVVINLPSPPLTPNPPRASVDDICESIKRGRENGRCLDIYLCRGKCLSYCDTQPNSRSTSFHLSQSLDEFVSLEEMFQLYEQWQVGHQIALSYLIASSVMQLMATPWLNSPLTSQSIRFSKGPGPLTASNISTVPESFILQTFPSKGKARAGCQECGVKDFMLELGIVLLEVWHWKAFTQYQQPVSPGSQQRLGSRYHKARTWLDSNPYSSLPWYVDAVTRCIEFTFAMDPEISTPTWDDPVLRKSISEYVLKPLKDNCLSALQ